MLCSFYISIFGSILHIATLLTIMQYLCQIFLFPVCKSCLVKHLEENNTCPTCNIVIHQSHPLQYISFDRTMQDIVYKLVPDLQDSKWLFLYILLKVSLSPQFRRDCIISQRCESHNMIGGYPFANRILIQSRVTLFLSE